MPEVFKMDSVRLNCRQNVEDGFFVDIYRQVLQSSENRAVSFLHAGGQIGKRGTEASLPRHAATGCC